jgi:uncharacterized heparinase superfamily protein
MDHELRAGAWDDPALPKLWRYNLHYFDDLNAQDAALRNTLHVALMAQWVRENPPAGGSGWEPYPASLRIVNWIKWSLAGNALPAECVHSLAVQTRHLSRRLEFHLLGNHLFANAKALVFAGLFFAGGEAERWLSKGMAILEEQVPEQILADGGQFERSTMYHALALEDMLDLINLLRVAGRPVPQAWPGVAARMVAWLKVMTIRMAASPCSTMRPSVSPPRTRSCCDMPRHLALMPPDRRLPSADSWPTAVTCAPRRRMPC